MMENKQIYSKLPKEFFNGYSVENIKVADKDVSVAIKINEHYNGLIAILLHGLAGSIAEPIINNSEREFQKFGCSTVLIESPLSVTYSDINIDNLDYQYHKKSLDMTIEKLSKKYPNAKFLLMGHSLGAFAVLDYLSEHYSDKVESCYLAAPYTSKDIGFEKLSKRANYQDLLDRKFLVRRNILNQQYTMTMNSRIFEKLHNFGPDLKLDNVKCATFILVGNEDTQIQKKSVEKVKKQIPNAHMLCVYDNHLLANPAVNRAIRTMGKKIAKANGR